MALILSGDSPSLSGTYQGGAITSGTAQASTSGTSIDFTSIPSWVKKITVMFNGVSTNGNSGIITQLGTSGGILASGYADSIGTISTITPSVLSAGTGFFTANLGASTDLVSGSLTLTLIGSNVWTASGNTRLTSVRICYSAGSVTLSGTLDRVRITTFLGVDTFDAGSINILYE
jgi:hypothetical protein